MKLHSSRFYFWDRLLLSCQTGVESVIILPQLRLQVCATMPAKFPLFKPLNVCYYFLQLSKQSKKSPVHLKHLEHNESSISFLKSFTYQIQTLTLLHLETSQGHLTWILCILFSRHLILPDRPPKQGWKTPSFLLWLTPYPWVSSTFFGHPDRFLLLLLLCCRSYCKHFLLHYSEASWLSLMPGVLLDQVSTLKAI